MRLPVAFRWLGIGVLGWIGLRGPIVARDFTEFRASLTRPASPPDGDTAAVTLQPPGSSQPVSNQRAIGPAVRGPRFIFAQTSPTVTPGNTIILDLPRPAPAPSAEPDAPAPPAPAPSAPTQASQLAEHGYRQLRLGDRKGAAALLAAAAETAAGDPRATLWAADRRMLVKRWSGDGYVLVRQGGTSRLLAATPTLGGSQAGARLAYVLNPLSDQRITLAGRIFQPLGQHSGRSKAAQAVLGVELQPRRKLPVVVAVDRYLALGPQARGAWALRLSGGAERLRVGSGLEASFYGQTGIIGIHSRDLYADGWAKLHGTVVERDGVRIVAGAGIWAGAQPGASRIDIGPSAEVAGRIGAAQVAASVDYRIRAAGNARPGNGPAVTVRAGF